MSKAKLVYLLAASHSGSTLLAMLLGAHREACTVGELKAVAFGNPELYRCSCGDLIRKCSFWGKTSELMRRKGMDFDITSAGTNINSTQNRCIRALLQPRVRCVLFEAVRDGLLRCCPGWRDHLAQVQIRNTALIETLLQMTGAKIIVDSSKRALRLKYLLKNPHLDIKVIRVLRDGRAVALTYVNPLTFADASDPRLRGGGLGHARPPQAGSLREAARSWKRNVEEAESLLVSLDRSQWMEVRYENLCKSPLNTLQGICQFLGLSENGIQLDFRLVKQHVIGNGMRMDTTSEIKLDERWRTNLSQDDLAIFDGEAGRLNRKYGYL